MLNSNNYRLISKEEATLLRDILIKIRDGKAKKGDFHAIYSIFYELDSFVREPCLDDIISEAIERAAIKNASNH